MPFCRNCSTQIYDTDNFCHNCSDSVKEKPRKATKGNIPTLIFSTLLTIWVTFETIYNYIEGLRGGYSALFIILLATGIIWLLVKPSLGIHIFLLVISTTVTIVNMFILLGYIFDVETTVTIKCMTLIIATLGASTAFFISKILRKEKVVIKKSTDNVEF